MALQFLHVFALKYAVFTAWLENGEIGDLGHISTRCMAMRYGVGRMDLPPIFHHTALRIVARVRDSQRAISQPDSETGRFP